MEDKYRIDIIMQPNKNNLYSWTVLKYESMAGWYKIKEGTSESDEQAFKDAKNYVYSKR